MDAAGRHVQLMIFVPSVDRQGQRVEQQYWVYQALDALGRLFGGATALPPGLGTWFDGDRGRLVWDQTVLVLLSVERTALTAERLQTLGRFLHRMGREADQGEVMCVVDGVNHHIKPPYSQA